MTDQTVLVFDGDDTLWMNEWQYSQATAEFFAYLYRIFREHTPNLHYLKDRFYQIDGELFEEWGIRRGRLAEAMLRTHWEVGQWIQERFGLDNVLNAAHEQRIREIGDQPFNYTKLSWLPEARLALQTLKDEGHQLCFLSSYDQRLFPERAKFLRLEQFFPPERVYTTDFKKTKEDFIRASGWTKEKDAATRWYAVGNGEIDILPALQISDRWFGIYVPHGSTSKYFSQEGQADHFRPPPLNRPRVATITSLRELRQALKQLEPKP